MPDLTVVIINFNTAEFLHWTIPRIQELAADPVKFTISDNGSNQKDLLVLNRISKSFPDVHVTYRQQSEAGSIGHGEALDDAVNQIETEYFCILDSDAMVLVRNWDKIIRSYFRANTIAVGVEASGEKPKDFPWVYFSMYHTARYKGLNASFLPATDGRDIATDTGYRVRELALEAGFESTVLPRLIVGKNKTNCSGSLMLFSKKYADYSGVYENSDLIVVSHFGRGAAAVTAHAKNFMQKCIFRLPVMKRLLFVLYRYRWFLHCNQVIKHNESAINSRPSLQ